MRSRLSYANVMATIAVFLAVAGGSAYAVGLGKGTVKTKTIKNGAVTTNKLGTEAVTKSKANLPSLGLQLNPGRVGLNPDPGQTLTATLFDRQGLKLVGRCSDDGAARDAEIEVTSSRDGLYRGIRGLDPSEDPALTQVSTVTGTSPQVLLSEQDESGQSSAFTQGRLSHRAGPTLWMDAFAATNYEGNDCQFMVTAVGLIE